MRRSADARVRGEGGRSGERERGFYSGAPAEGGASSVPDADALIFGTGGRSKRARVPVVGDYADNDSSDDVISIHSDEDNWDDDVVERFAGSSSDEDAGTPACTARSFNPLVVMYSRQA